CWKGTPYRAPSTFAPAITASLIRARFVNSARCSSTSQDSPEVSAERIDGITSWFKVVICATELDASAALTFSSLEASGTHWEEKQAPVISFSPVSAGPEASGVVGVWTTDIQVSSPLEPPPPPEPEDPQEVRAPAPARPAAAKGRDFRRVLRCIMRGGLP